MNKNTFSPYIRIATLSTLTAPFLINERIIFDYEIIFAGEGKCRITIDNIEYICKRNDLIFIPPGVSHKFECIENSDFVQPHIHFDISYSEKSEETPISFKPRRKMSEYELSLIQEDILREANIPYVFVPHDIEKFKKMFFEIISLFQEKSYNYELLCKAKLLELLDYIITQFSGSSAPENKTSYNCVVAAKNYIDNNYLSAISLDGLSEQFYLNKFTLMRKFKTMYKENIISYYRKKRIEYAKKVLQETDLSIHALAEKLSFTDIYSFSRFFKGFVGCSPSAYRKQQK